MRRLRSPPFNADALDASRARGEEVREERRSGKGLLPLSHNVSRLTVRCVKGAIVKESQVKNSRPRLPVIGSVVYVVT